VAQLIIPDRGDDERSGFGRRILPDIDDGMGGVCESCFGLRGAGFGAPFPAEKFVRAIRWDMFEKIGKRREALIAFALVVEYSRAQKVEFWAMVGEAVDLAVVESCYSESTTFRLWIRTIEALC
jgi:hypothetical protein